MLTQHTADTGFRYYTDASDNKLLGVTTAIGCVSLSTWRLIRWTARLEREYMRKVSTRAFQQAQELGYSEYGFTRLMSKLTERVFAGVKFGKSSADSGTAGHLEIEKYLNFDPTSTFKLSPLHERLENFFQCVGSDIPWLSGQTEVALENELEGEGYAGTCDYIVDIGDDYFVVADWKFGRAKYVDHGMQLAAYAKAYAKKTGRICKGGFGVYFKHDEYVYYPPEELDYMYVGFLTRLSAVWNAYLADERDVPEPQSFSHGTIGAK